MKRIYKFLILMAVVLLVGCSNKNKNPEKASAEKGTLPVIQKTTNETKSQETQTSISGTDAATKQNTDIHIENTKSFKYKNISIPVPDTWSKSKTSTGINVFTSNNEDKVKIIIYSDENKLYYQEDYGDLPLYMLKDIVYTYITNPEIPEDELEVKYTVTNLSLTTVCGIDAIQYKISVQAQPQTRRALNDMGTDNTNLVLEAVCFEKDSVPYTIITSYNYHLENGDKLLKEILAKASMQ